MAFLDSNLHTPLAIVTENELGLAFPPRNLPKKISSRSVRVLLSYRGNKQTNRQTNKQTDRQTNQRRKNIIPRFRGDNYYYFWFLFPGVTGGLADLPKKPQTTFIKDKPCSQTTT